VAGCAARLHAEEVKARRHDPTAAGSCRVTERMVRGTASYGASAPQLLQEARAQSNPQCNGSGKYVLQHLWADQHAVWTQPTRTAEAPARNAQSLQQQNCMSGLRIR
jgi:hypothetical protein